MIIAIAIDYENGILMDHCVEKLSNLDNLVLDCIKSEFVYARLEIAFRAEELRLTKPTLDMLIKR